MNVRDRIQHRRVDGKVRFKLETDNSAKVFAQQSGYEDFKLALSEEALSGSGDYFYFYFDREALEDLRDFASFLIQKIDGEEEGDTSWDYIVA